MIIIFDEFGDPINLKLRLPHSYDGVCWANTINLTFLNLFIKQWSFSNTNIDIHTKRGYVRFCSACFYSVFGHEHLKLCIYISISLSFIGFHNYLLLLSLHCNLFSSFLPLLLNFFNLFICWLWFTCLNLLFWKRLWII